MLINTKYSIGDEFLIEHKWFATLTAIEISGNRSVVTAVYKLEWVSDGCFKSEWFTEDRLLLLGIRKRDV
jgi:membrane-associated PAP2 superfamily phosphatase